MGTPDSARPSLEAILAAGHEVPLVVTQPDRPAGRSKAPLPPPVKVSAEGRGLRVVQPEKVRAPEFLAQLVAAAPDALVVVAYGRILAPAVLAAAPLGAVNLHFSILPAYRGAAPVQWALAHGESETGVTTFRLDGGVDTGPLLLQHQVPIVRGERAPALLARLAVEGAPLLAATLKGLADGSIRPVPQDDAKATLAPILLREHGFWDPAWSARELTGRVCGFDPWPGVWAVCGSRRLRVAESAAMPAAATESVPGTVIAVSGDAVFLACAGGTVASILSLQPAGGRAMRAREAVNGRLLAPGDRFERPQSAA